MEVSAEFETNILAQVNEEERDIMPVTIICMYDSVIRMRQSENQAVKQHDRTTPNSLPIQSATTLCLEKHQPLARMIKRERKINRV